MSFTAQIGIHKITTEIGGLQLQLHGEWSPPPLNYATVNAINCEPLHFTAWWNFSWTLATSKTLLNVKVIDQRSRSPGFLSVFACMIGYCSQFTAWTTSPGFTKCHSLDDATWLLPEATAATLGKYLALSKAWQSCLSLYFYIKCVLTFFFKFITFFYF